MNRSTLTRTQPQVDETATPTIPMTVTTVPAQRTSGSTPEQDSPVTDGHGRRVRPWLVGVAAGVGGVVVVAALATGVALLGDEPAAPSAPAPAAAPIARTAPLSGGVDVAERAGIESQYAGGVDVIERRALAAAAAARLSLSGGPDVAERSALAAAATDDGLSGGPDVAERAGIERQQAGGPDVAERGAAQG